MMEALSIITDEQLVISYSMGNNLAFDELLNRHQKTLYNYIYFIVKNRELAEDIFQETFVKAIITIKQGRYTENGKFKAWITRIAHNIIIDYFRQEKTDHTIYNDGQDLDLLNDASLCENTIEDHLIYSQIMKDIQRIVRFLPDSQREVLELRYYKGLSFKEISELKNISINTALGRVRYAILNMRKMAEENGILLSIS